jgi:tetratricopeptide (TPR) repeat protein
MVEKSAKMIGVLAAMLLFSSGFAGMALAQTSVAADAQVDAQSLKKEIEKLRNEKEYEAKRVEEMRQEREQFVKEIRRVENLNTKYSKDIEDVRSQMSEQQASFEQRMKKLESDLKDAQQTQVQKPVEPVVADPNAPSPMEIEKKANEVLQKGGDLDPEDEKFKEELARAHYNMGNVYFERGEYQRAVVEYYQAVDLLPYDADAHYNLAYVSGEFIGDPETALKHYQWYLYLKPNATDKKFIEEKIVSARMHARAKTNSRIDTTELTGQMNVAR